jgi:hypothetical protein
MTDTDNADAQLFHALNNRSKRPESNTIADRIISSISVFDHDAVALHKLILQSSALPLA